MLKNKFFMILLSAVVAFGLWVYVVTVISPEYETTISDIPVKIVGEDLLEYKKIPLVLMTEDVPKVDLKLYGNRSDLNKLTNENITIRVDVSNVAEPGEQSLNFTISYPGHINENEIQVQSRNPGRINLVFEKLVRKDVPVEVIYSGTQAEGYIIDKTEATLDHEKISISGPESVVNQIAKATIKVDLEGRTESFSESYRYTLCDENGKAVDASRIVTNAAEVKHTLIIRKVKEIALRVNLIESGGATADTVEVLIDPQTIRIAGSEAALEGLEELVLGSIDLSKISGMTRYDMEIVLPTGVTNITGVTKAGVIVRVKERQTKTFEITSSQIQLINVPEKMKATLVSQNLTITIRGTQEQLNQMTAEDILVQVDLSGESKKGMVTLKPEIILPEKFQGAGPVNAPSVSVELAEDK